MKPLLKAEFRKLLTIRSTYVASGIGLLFVGFMSFYIEGFRGIAGTPASVGAPTALNSLVINTAVVGIIAGIVAILYMAHEYRYNLITYTLTSSNSRTKVLLSKLLTVISYASAYALIGGLFAIISYRLGLAIRGTTLAPQDFDMLYIFGRLIYYSIGFSLAGLLFTVLFRNLALSIVAIFMLPSTVEGLLSLLLKDNSRYLPFSALQQVIEPRGGAGDTLSLSAGQAAVIFLIYLVIGWVVTWYFFLKRDAS